MTNASSPAISGGVTAFPMRENECVIPCAKPQLPTRRPAGHRARGRGKAGAFAESQGQAQARTARRTRSPRP